MNILVTVGALLRQRKFDLVILRADKEQLEKLIVYFEQQGKGNEKETILPVLQDRRDILAAQAFIAQRNSDQPVAKKSPKTAKPKPVKIQPKRTVADFDDHFSKQEISRQIEAQISEVLSLLQELDDYLDAELQPKKARIESTEDALDSHFEQANMARFALARSVIQKTESKSPEYFDDVEIERPKPNRSSGDIVEVYSPEKEDKITFETVGSSKSSIKGASYLGMVRPVTKLRPVSSVSSFDDDDDEDVFEPSPREHTSESSPVRDTSSQQAFEIDSQDVKSTVIKRTM